MGGKWPSNCDCCGGGSSGGGPDLCELELDQNNGGDEGYCATVDSPGDGVLINLFFDPQGICDRLVLLADPGDNCVNNNAGGPGSSPADEDGVPFFDTGCVGSPSCPDGDDADSRPPLNGRGPWYAVRVPNGTGQIRVLVDALCQTGQSGTGWDLSLRCLDFDVEELADGDGDGTSCTWDDVEILEPTGFPSAPAGQIGFRYNFGGSGGVEGRMIVFRNPPGAAVCDPISGPSDPDNGFLVEDSGWNTIHTDFFADCSFTAPGTFRVMRFIRQTNGVPWSATESVIGDSDRIGL